MKLEEKSRKINLKAVIAVTVCIALIAGLVSFDFIRSRKEYSDTDVAMNTVINLRLYGPDGEKTAAAVKEEIRSIENNLLSRYSKTSDVSRINSSDGKAVTVSPEVGEIISKAEEVSEKCGGVFDITIGKISALWDFGGKNQRLPSDDEIAENLTYVGYKKYKFSGSGITLGEKQELDLGAVGKGAACDMIRSLLSFRQTDSAVISVGGSLLLYGKRNFSIGIVNPENDRQSMGTLSLSDTCVSTSGSYEQFFEQNEKTYHHILNAATGYPAESHLLSVTVVCDSGVLSDALSTACYILGYNNTSLAMLKEFEAEAVFITKEKVVRCTDGIRDDFKITDGSYKMGK